MIAELFILLLLRKTSCEDIVSGEKKNYEQEKTDKHIASIDMNNRRFHQDLSDTEWHISHLKDTEFSRRSECAEDTVEDKIRKYRKSLKNDGGRVEYVFAETLPFDKADLVNLKTCPAPNSTALFMASLAKISKNNRTEGTTDKANIAATPELNNDKRRENETDQITDTATTPAMSKIANLTAPEKSRRASEYQFSSVEYYDEVTLFNDNMCPGVIDVISLEIDQLRNYDVECERIIEWRSLDN